MLTSFVIMWEDPNGERKWEVTSENQTAGFLTQLLNQGVNPATMIVAYSPMLFHFVWPEYHNGLSDVFFGRINEELYGSDPKMVSKHEPVDVAESAPRIEKYGWISPDGRYFQCNYGGHSDLASTIVGSIEDIFDPEQHLENLGWAKIFHNSMNAQSTYAIGMGYEKRLTDDQIKTLDREDLLGCQFISLYL